MTPKHANSRPHRQRLQHAAQLLYALSADLLTHIPTADLLAILCAAHTLDDLARETKALPKQHKPP